MPPQAELSRMFASVHQAVIGTDGKDIIFANAAAKEAIGFDLTDRSASGLIPREILDSTSDDFVCATTIMGRKASISVVKYENMSLLFLDFIDREKSSFLVLRSIMSNLRNCTMGLKMSADRCFSLMEDGELPDEKYTSALYHYYYSLVRTLTQIDTADLLERGDMLFSPVPTDLVKLCSELCDTIVLLNTGSGINIRFSTDESELMAVVDPSGIEQLLLNLFSNSIQHTHTGGSITLSLHRTGNRIVLSMDDDGDGIPHEILSSIFCLPEDSGKGNMNSSGNGFGLYIAFGIAQLHNGVLLVESRENIGTQVRVMLPTDENPSPKFNCPETAYRHSGVSNILTALADVLPSSCFGLKYED